MRGWWQVVVGVVVLCACQAEIGPTSVAPGGSPRGGSPQLVLRLCGGGLRDKKRAEKYQKLKKAAAELRKSPGKKKDSHGNEGKQPEKQPASEESDGSHGRGEEEEEDLRREVTEQVQREVRDGLAKERQSKEDEERRERNRTRKKLRKQAGRLTPSTKNRIRSIERTLARKGDKIPEEAKAKMRARVEELRGDFDTVKLVEKEKRYAARYRKVKFFERKKIERQLAQNKRELEAEGLDGAKRKRLEKKRMEILEDLQYVLYFPRDMRYVSVLNNPRSVVEKLRSTDEFKAKSERAKEIVLAYRAAKLNQKRADASGVPNEESEEEEGSVTQEDGSSQAEKPPHGAKRGSKAVQETPSKARKTKKARVEEEEEEAVGSTPDVSDPDAFLEMMREEQSKNMGLLSKLNPEEESEGGAEDRVQVGDTAELGRPDSEGDEEVGSDSEDEDEDEDDESEEKMKGFLRDKVPESEVRHRAENCLGPGDEDDILQVPKQRKGAKAPSEDARHAAESAKSEKKKDKGGKTPRKGRSAAETSSSEDVGGFVDMSPGRSKGRPAQQAEQRTEAPKESAGGGEKAAPAKKIDPKMQKFLDEVNKKVAKGGSKDELLQSSEPVELEREEGMPEAAAIHSFGLQGGKEAFAGIEKERQRLLKEAREMDRQRAEEEKDDSSAEEPDPKQDPEGYKAWQKAKKFLRGSKRQALRDLKRDYAGSANALKDFEGEDEGGGGKEEEVLDDDELMGDDDDDIDLDKKLDAALEGAKHKQYAEFSKMEFDNLGDAIVGMIRKQHGGNNPKLKEYEEAIAKQQPPPSESEPSTSVDDNVRRGSSEGSDDGDVKRWTDDAKMSEPAEISGGLRPVEPRRVGSSPSKKSKSPAKRAGMKTPSKAHREESSDESTGAAASKITTPTWKSVGRKKKKAREQRRQGGVFEDDTISAAADMLRTPAPKKRAGPEAEGRRVARAERRAAGFVGEDAVEAAADLLRTPVPSKEFKERRAGSTPMRGAGGKGEGRGVGGEASVLKSVSKAQPRSVAVSSLPLNEKMPRAANSGSARAPAETSSGKTGSSPRKEAQPKQARPSAKAEAPDPAGRPAVKPQSVRATAPQAPAAKPAEPQTPPRVRDLLGRIDSFLEQRKSKKGLQTALKGGGDTSMRHLIGKEVQVARAAHGAESRGRKAKPPLIQKVPGPASRTASGAPR